MLFCAISAAGQQFRSNLRHIDKFEKEVLQIMNGSGVPGMSLAIIENDQVVYSNGFGVRERKTGEKVTKETVFDGCSLSKSFLVFVVYQLVDEGKLDLDKPMYHYLEHPKLTYDNRYKLITPRMILSHSSGLENWAEYNNMDTLEILSTPGERFIYSGEGYQYLAKVAEKITGKSYEEYVRERVLVPLSLNNTYLKYEKTDGKEAPSNYAVGHEAFGNTNTFKNSKTLPAAGNHFTAEDYAKLIVSLFDKRFITPQRRKDILRPMVKVHSSALAYGGGFEVFFTGRDTIIAHGGDKAGYKNIMLYSVAKRKGLVFMANGDRGKLMMDRLNDLTSKLDISIYVDALYYQHEQYPSVALALMKTYDDFGIDSMLANYERLKSRKKLSMNTLNVLSNFLRYGGGDGQIARKILEYDVEMNPGFALVQSLAGDMYLDLGEYLLALEHLTRAKSLKFDLWDIDDDIVTCEKGIVEARRRLANITTVRADVGAMVEAEDYTAMRGVSVLTTKDTVGAPRKLGYIETGDWMEYKLDVVQGGLFEVTIRVAAISGGSQIQFYTDNSKLGLIDIPATNGWGKFVNQASTISLPTGVSTLRLLASQGGFHINWLKLSPAVSPQN